jgi:protein-L-isoaspartate(D-aspartate) O-methyltransferase
MTKAETTILGATNRGDFAAARTAMVLSQLRPNAVTDARVVAAMGEVERDRFVPQGMGPLAYRDRPLPIGAGRELNAPLATARLLVEAGIAPGDRVLLIGAAGGYTAALLAKLARHVVAVESDPSLANSARAALAGAENVELIEGVLSAGHPDGAPYDLIVIDGAVEQLEQALVDQLKVGGRLVSGIIERGVSRLASGARSEGGFALVPFADIDCVTLPGFARPRTFQF